ncbi:hypothetical protein DXT73_27210 [Escherichia coli]|nr:hypothetical protein DXT73_27210 [Escherichia coli]
MTSLKTSIKTITYLSDTGCLEIQGASLATVQITVSRKCITQEEMDELYALSERLKEKCAGN